MISLKKRHSERLFNLVLCGVFFIVLFIITEYNKPLKKAYYNNSEVATVQS